MTRQDDMWRDAEAAEGRRTSHDIGQGLREHVGGVLRPSVTYRDGQPAEIHPAGGPESVAVRPGPPDPSAEGERPADEPPARRRALYEADWPPPQPPSIVDLIIRRVTNLKLDRVGNHRPGTGPAYRMEGEQTAFGMVLDLLRDLDPPSIACPKCGTISYHPTDVEQKYCGRCHAYHDQLKGDQHESSDVHR